MGYIDKNSTPGSPLSMDRALGQSESFLRFQEQLSRVAPIDRPVLILGERGSGKELAAARIHFLSKRWQKPLITLNCSALTKSLIGSELFGYEKGAFTGAGARRPGRFEQASEGTLFLDEIGTIPMEVQEKILRAVEYGVFERVGSSTPVHVDVRIVAATNADLEEMAGAGTFKQDLLDRLSFEVIYVPPLRHRKEDILLLAHHFAGRMAFELGWNQVPGISSRSAKILQSYPWPGNIRELKNVIERAVYRTDEPDEIRIDPESFQPFRPPYGPPPKQDRFSEMETWEQTDVTMIGGTKTGNQTDATIIKGIKTEEHNTPLEEKPRQPPYGNKGYYDSYEDHDIRLEHLLELPLKSAVLTLETHMVSKALETCRFNQKKAADLLGLTYDQFRGIKKRLKKSSD